MGSNSSFQCRILRENSADWVAGQPSFPAEPSLSSARLSDFLVVLWVGAGEEGGIPDALYQLWGKV